MTKFHNLMNLKQFITLVFFITGILRLSFSQHVNVPSDHQVYSFLSRMEAKGLIDSYELRTLPLPRWVIAELLSRTVELATSEPNALTRVDRQRLQRFLGDFRQELSPEFTKHADADEPHFFTLSEPAGNLVTDLTGSQKIITHRKHSLPEPELLSRTSVGARIRGHLGSVINFYTESRFEVSRGENIDSRFKASEGDPVVTTGENAVRDRALAYVAGGTSWLRFQAGRDELNWGPSLRYNTAISYNMPPADQIKLTSRWNRFKFTSVHAWLRNDLGAKHLTSHRLDLKIAKGIYAGAGESVVYGGRGPEPSYLNPIMLYHIRRASSGRQRQQRPVSGCHYYPLSPINSVRSVVY
ncbi:MAG: hypothetical protein U5R06_19905 [candidate division KSB1 bacterium]|nr:hypothetical protein [candidate division KSB1 bacterium]